MQLTTKVTPKPREFAVLSSIAHNTILDDSTTQIERFIEAKKQSAFRFPDLNLNSFKIFKAGDQMFASLNSSTKEVIISFSGHNFALTDGATCLISALKFTRDVAVEYKDWKIILNGFGPGACLAERVAYFTSFSCHTFNPELMSLDYDCIFRSLPNVTSNIFEPIAVAELFNLSGSPLVPEINLNQDQLMRVKGIYIDIETNNCSFVLRPLTTENEDDVHVNDLLTALAILYDNQCETKQFSFSLEPADPKNPQGQYQKKVYWPDKVHEKPMLQGTELGEVFFEADWHMKQMAMGVEVLNSKDYTKAEFVYPEKLKKLGLKPYHKYTDLTSVENDWSRLWLVTKELKVNKEDPGRKEGSKYFEISDVVMGVEARQMRIGKSGKLKDLNVQNPDHNSQQFANKFTELFEEIAKEYPVYRRLKQATKAIALAQWIWVNKVPININEIQAIVQKEREKMKDHTVYIPSLEYCIQNESTKTRVFGGVHINIEFGQLVTSVDMTDCECEGKKPAQVQISFLSQTLASQNLQNRVIRHTSSESSVDSLSQSKLSQSTKGKVDSGKRKIQCQGCQKLINGTYVEINSGAKFHADCFRCAKCDQALEDEVFKLADIAYMHQDCCSAVAEKLSGINAGYQFSCLDLEKKGKPKLTVFEWKLKKLIQANQSEEGLAYRLTPPKAQSQCGYTFGHTPLDATYNSGVLYILRDILEKTEMKDIEKIITKIRTKKVLTQEEISVVNEKLNTDYGRQILDNIRPYILKHINAYIQSIINSIPDPVIKKKMKSSEHAQLLLFDYDSLFKIGPKMKKYLAEEQVSMCGGITISLDKEANIVEELQRFVDTTKYAKINKKEIDLRRENASKVAKKKKYWLV